MITPNSPQMQAIWDLFLWSLGIGTLIFALVTGLVLYSAFRFRARSEQDEPVQSSGNTRLEVAWTIAPALLLVVLFVATVSVMRAADPPADRDPDIIVTGFQWWWRVEYPETGIVTANEIHIPVGRQMLVQLEASDVIHNFWVPELAPKKDMVPGHQNTIWLAADRAGTFLGVCAEFCGAQHAWMRMLVIAEPEADFQAWQQRQMDVPAAPATDLAAEGARLYQDLTCINCHAIAGVGGDVGAGPDLTHLMSRQTLGAGTIANTPENLARWIANPHEFKPAVFMPPYAHWLTDEQLRALVAYLETLR